MRSDRFRTWICEDEPGQEWISSDRMAAADQEMANDGYEYLEHFICDEDSRSVHVRLYERRPPTVNQRARQVLSAFGYDVWYRSKSGITYSFPVRKKLTRTEVLSLEALARTVAEEGA